MRIKKDKPEIYTICVEVQPVEYLVNENGEHFCNMEVCSHWSAQFDNKEFPYCCNMFGPINSSWERPKLCKACF